VRRGLVVLLGAAVAAGGCSPFMRKLPAGHHPGDEPRCSAALDAPVADAAGATTAGAVAACAAAVFLQCDEACLAPFVAVPAAVVAVIYAGSAIHGLRNRTRCRRALRTWREGGG